MSQEDEVVTTGYVAKELLSFILYLAASLVCIYLLLTYVGQRTVVNGSSMEDTLSDQDNLITDKWTYRHHNPKRYDVIVFPYQPGSDVYYIKRIMGLPGETVYIDADGTIYINEEPIYDPYGTETILNPGLASQTIQLGPDEFFVLGDNRNNSTDSRFEVVGNVKKSEIIGKAWVRIYPFNKIGKVCNIK